MKFQWLVQSKDVAKVKALIAETSERSFVLNRIERNVPARRLKISREKFWFAMLGCLMTTSNALARIVRYHDLLVLSPSL